MATRTRPTDEDRVDAVRLVLLGLATGEDHDSTLDRLGRLHLPKNTFPAEVLLELAAEAIAESGASQADPIEYEGIRERYLSEYEFRGKSEQHKSHYALTAAAMIRAGLYPDLLDEAYGWGIEDMWKYAFYTLVAYVRAASERTGRSLEEIAAALAEHQGITLAAKTPYPPAMDPESLRRDIDAVIDPSL
jgi:hypothetical protein